MVVLIRNRLLVGRPLDDVPSVSGGRLYVAATYQIDATEPKHAI
jgi:hypothetical protein